MSRTLRTDELADILSVHTETVKEWVARGCPCDKGGRGKSHKFDEAEVAAWMWANNLTGEVGKPKEPISEELAAAKLRKELALARKYELDNQRAEGLLIERADVERQNVAKITVIRNRLLGLGAKLSPILEGMNGAERQQMIDAEINELLTEFSRS